MKRLIKFIYVVLMPLMLLTLDLLLWQAGKMDMIFVDHNWSLITILGMFHLLCLFAVVQFSIVHSNVSLIPKCRAEFYKGVGAAVIFKDELGIVLPFVYVELAWKPIRKYPKNGVKL